MHRKQDDLHLGFTLIFCHVSGTFPMEQRLIDIELKLVSLEDSVESLNQLVYTQQKQLDDMRALCKLLLGRLDERDDHSPARSPADERPPHY